MNMAWRRLRPTTHDAIDNPEIDETADVPTDMTTKLPLMKTQRPFTTDKKHTMRASLIGGNHTAQNFAKNLPKTATGQQFSPNTTIHSKMHTNALENKRKVSEAMGKLMRNSAFDVTSGGASEMQFNSFLNTSVPSGESAGRPRVLSLNSRTLKLGELSAAKTKFQLRHAPRVNQI